MGAKWKNLTEGAELVGPRRTLTMNRINWYAEGFWTICADERRGVMANIPTDVEFAKSEGLETAIGDGMTATNWVSEMVLDYFGEHYLRGPHSLRTKFIKPTPLDAFVSVGGKVTGIEETESGRVYKMDIWTKDGEGTLLTVGDASVSVPSGA
jgi:hypothetical protein